MSAVLDQSLMELWTAVYQSNPSAFNVRLEETIHREVNSYHMLLNPAAPASARRLAILTTVKAR